MCFWGFSLSLSVSLSLSLSDGPSVPCGIPQMDHGLSVADRMANLLRLGAQACTSATAAQHGDINATETQGF